jgi:hypothetical protein
MCQSAGSTHRRSPAIFSARCWTVLCVALGPHLPREQTMNRTSAQSIVALLAASLLGCETSSARVVADGSTIDQKAKSGEAGPKPDGLGKLDQSRCPPVLRPCNWCGGSVLRDDWGCPVRYECANGVDPCQTQPCSTTTPTGCATDEVCGQDKLCWPQTFACGAKRTCTTAQEYCREVAPGPCGGPTPGDAGTCPADCVLTPCLPGGQNVCLCKTYSCEPLPPQCSSCGCLNDPMCVAVTGPMCAQTPSGSITVSCGMP